jgi:hypothetical protein
LVVFEHVYTIYVKVNYTLWPPEYLEIRLVSRFSDSERERERTKVY